MKICVVGDFRHPIHEIGYVKAFKELKIEVATFSFSKYFLPSSNIIFKKLNNFQEKYLVGFTPLIIHIAFLIQLKKFKEPTTLFFYRTRILNPIFFKKSLKKHTIIIYNNDDPFSSKYPKNYWKNYFELVKYSNHIFSYRKNNINQYQKLGYTNVSLLRSHFDRDFIFPMDLNVRPHDVSFLGHYENDGRDKLFLKLYRQGINLKIFGPEWRNSPIYNELVKYQKKDIQSLNIEDYNQVLNQSKICIVLFSKLNNDQYTRRCFEIPRTKSLMISQYSSEISEIFKENEEIIFFKQAEDLAEKIKYYIRNESVRNLITNNAFTRLNNDGHELRDRASQIIQTLNNLIN